MNAARLWPVAIVGVLAITVAANIVLLLAANDRDAAVAEPDYYRKAVAWDSTLAITHRSDALGWTLDARLAAAAHGSATLELRLTDHAGRPLQAEAVSVTALHSLPPMRVVEAAGAFDASGFARLSLPLERAGLWELRLRVRRGADTFVVTTHRELAAPTRMPDERVR